MIFEMKWKNKKTSNDATGQYNGLNILILYKLQKFIIVVYNLRYSIHYSLCVCIYLYINLYAFIDAEVFKINGYSC